MESTESQSSSSGTFPRTHDTGSAPRDSRWQKPEDFQDRIIFMSMYNDVDWSQGKEIFKTCVSHSAEVKAHAHRLPKGHWSFLGPGTEEKWYGTHTYKPEGLWNRSAEMMMPNLGESGHPAFRATCADRGFLKSKTFTVTCRMQSCCFAHSFPSTSSVTTEQLRICVGCGELAQQISDHAFSSRGKRAALMNEQLSCEHSPEVVSVSRNRLRSTLRHRETCC